MDRKGVYTVILAGILAISCSRTSAPVEEGLPGPVLLEQITNYKCYPCKGASEVLDSFQSLYPDRVFLVKVHVDVPYPGDPLYIDRSDSVVRYYGLNPEAGVPILVIGGDYVEVGFDDAQRGDYVERWFNKMKELAISDDPYSPSMEAYHTSLGLDIRVETGSPLSPEHRSFMTITERHVPLPDGSVKPYSHFAMRAHFPDSMHISMDVDSTWNSDSLFVVFHVHDADGRVVSVGGKPLERAFVINFLSTGTGEADTTVEVNGEARFEMHVENRMSRAALYTLRLLNVPRDWTSIVCIGNACVRGTTASDTLQPGEVKEGSGFYFTIIPTTVDTVSIEVILEVSDRPVLREAMRAEVKVR